jgi:tetratricopeptide (TPR) repeat protein
VTRWRAAITLAVVGVAIGLAAGVLHARDTRAPLPVSQERLIYLRSGRTADRVFLTFDALAADVYWMRAIQHYGRDRKSTRVDGRFELLLPLLDLTTTLDPYFSIAYRFGAIFLSMDPPNGPGRPDLAIGLLEKGLVHRPDRWQYAHDIGFVNYWHTGDFAQAASWFDRASKMPGSPEWIRQVAAVTLVEGGDRSGARQILSELLGAEESYVRAAAERSLAQLQALDAVDQLQALVDRYRQATGALPRGWRDLIERRYLTGVPVDRTGTPFDYDPDTGVIGIGARSDLRPLPRALEKR